MIEIRERKIKPAYFDNCREVLVRGSLLAS